ncbi:hypothetical protein EJ110_NYTH54711 [Nymphaea thermarum]|nr:hypothetical protein EJ110_NYTH54711 [Nymphaea thermarum]
MTPVHSSPSSSSSDHSEGGAITFPISSPTASQFEARPRPTSRLSLFADSGDSDSVVTAPRPKPVVSLKSVHIKSSPSAKSSGDDYKPSLRPPKRIAPTCGAENSKFQERRRKSRKGGKNGEVEAIEKMTPDSQGDDQKKGVAGTWTEEHEIRLLRGLIAYIRQKGSMNDMQVFLRSISAALHMDVEESELLDKIENLKKEYEENVEKASDGKPLVFRTPHEQKVYEISRDVWAVKEDAESKDEDQEGPGALAKDSSCVGVEDVDAVVKGGAEEVVLKKMPRAFILERKNDKGALFRGMIKNHRTFNSRYVIDKLLLSIEPPKGKNSAEIEEEVCGKALEAYINWLDYHVNSTKLALEALRGTNFLRKQNIVNVGHHTAVRNSHSAEQFAQLLVVPYGQLNVARYNPRLLVVTGSVPSKLQNLQKVSKI